MIIKHGRQFGGGEIHKVRKGMWAFYLDCAFWMLIGWALRAHGDHVHNTFHKSLSRWRQPGVKFHKG